jgi:hypothetical protein
LLYSKTLESGLGLGITPSYINIRINQNCAKINFICKFRKGFSNPEFLMIFFNEQIKSTLFMANSKPLLSYKTDFS